MNAAKDNNKSNAKSNTKLNALKRIMIFGGALLVVGGPILAQQDPPEESTQAEQKPQRVRQVNIANVPVALMEILTPINDSQKTKIIAIQDKFTADAKALVGNRAKISALSRKASDDIRAVLTPEQLSIITAEAPAVRILRNTLPRIHVSLAALAVAGVTKDQLDSIVAVANNEQTQIKSLKDLKGDERKTKNSEISQEIQKKLNSILNTDQKEALAKYMAAHPEYETKGKNTKK